MSCSSDIDNRGLAGFLAEGVIFAEDMVDQPMLQECHHRGSCSGACRSSGIPHFYDQLRHLEMELGAGDEVVNERGLKIANLEDQKAMPPIDGRNPHAETVIPFDEDVSVHSHMRIAGQPTT